MVNILTSVKKKKKPPAFFQVCWFPVRMPRQILASMNEVYFLQFKTLYPQYHREEVADREKFLAFPVNFVSHQ